MKRVEQTARIHNSLYKKKWLIKEFYNAFGNWLIYSHVQNLKEMLFWFVDGNKVTEKSHNFG